MQIGDHPTIANIHPGTSYSTEYVNFMPAWGDIKSEGLHLVYLLVLKPNTDITLDSSTSPVAVSAS